MRKVIIDVDTLHIETTGSMTIKEVAKAGEAATLSAIAAQIIEDGWESGEDALIAVCDDLWHAFRQERPEKETNQ